LRENVPFFTGGSALGTKHKPNLFIAVSYVLIWFVVRVLVFPVLFMWYAKLENKKLSEIPSSIPKKCLVGSGVFLGLNIYWWIKIIQWAILRHMGKQVAMEDLASLKKQG
jgi:hypothetical protein